MERKRPLGLYRQCVREEADPSHADFHLGLSAVSARTLLNPKRHCFSESSKNLAFFSSFHTKVDLWGLYFLFLYLVALRDL